MAKDWRRDRREGSREREARNDVVIISKAAKRAMVLKNGFANGLGDKTVERSVQGLKIASPVRFMDKTT